MAGFRIEGNTSGNVAEVDASNALKVSLNDASETNGILAATSRADAGEYTSTNLDIDPEADADYRLRIAQDRLEFHETWQGSALNSAQWSSTVTTMTTAVSGGYLTLNSGSSVATSAVARVQSYRTFSLPTSGSLTLTVPMKITAASQGIANQTWEAGFFIASGITAPTDGIFLRTNASGELRLVANYNGTEIQSSVINTATTIASFGGNALFPVAVDREVVIIVNAHVARCWIDDVLVASLEQHAAFPTFFQSGALPISFRIYNASGSSPASATQVQIGTMSVAVGGFSTAPALSEVSAMSGAGAYQGQSGGTMGSTANWVNSTVPATATLSNTAAGYTTLGGAFVFTAPASAETDFALFGFQVPAIAVGAINRNLLIKGIRIDAVNQGAAVATTATVMSWALGVGSTAVSLATAEAATAKARRVIPLGFQSWIVGAAIGAPVEAIRHTFDGGVLAEPGTFVHVILRVHLGTATASQTIRGAVSIDAYYV